MATQPLAPAGPGTSFVFLVDTSASMNQRMAGGMRYLDLAKSAVESFCKIRSRDTSKPRPDRYILATYEEGLNCIRCGGNQPFPQFLHELKCLEAKDVSRCGASLKTCFEYLNLFRAQAGIDSYTQGRNPCLLDPGVVILITDGIMPDINEKELRGGDMTIEPYRWEQRLYTLLLRIPAIGTPVSNSINREESSFFQLCDEISGKVFPLTNAKSLSALLESLNSRIQPAVAVSFEPVGQGASLPSESAMPASLHRLLRVPLGQKAHAPYMGNWPIPEAYSADRHDTVPPRAAHPVLLFATTSCDPQIVEGLPFDKYELEPCPLTQHILSQKRTNVCWNVYVENSSRKEGLGSPFGYLKPSSQGNSVNLIVLPYNYEALIPLVTSLTKVHKMAPPKQWQAEFEAYLRSIPAYYVPLLKTYMKKLGGHVVPDVVDPAMRPLWAQFLYAWKQQKKLDGEKTMTAITQRPPTPYLVEHAQPSLTGAIPPLSELHSSPLYLNPFTVPRSGLLKELATMRQNLDRLNRGLPKTSLLREGLKHNIPIGAMGNYHDAMRAKSELRSLFPEDDMHVLTFGNPFRLQKHAMLVDEAEDVDDANAHAPSPKPRRRKISTTPSPTPPVSPSPVSPTTPPHSPIPLQSRPVPMTSSPTPVRPTPPSPVPPSATPPHIAKKPVPRPVGHPAPTPQPHRPLVTGHTQGGIHVPKSMSHPPQGHPPLSSSSLQTPQGPGSSNLASPSPPLRNPPRLAPPSSQGLLSTSSSSPNPPMHPLLSQPLLPPQSRPPPPPRGAMNPKVKEFCRKELRKPTKDHSQIFLAFKDLDGDLEERKSIVREIIEDAKLLKKLNLLPSLEEYLSAMK